MIHAGLKVHQQSVSNKDIDIWNNIHRERSKHYVKAKYSHLGARK